MALHALEPEDEQDFLAHLSGADLPARPAAARGRAGELAYAADAVEPHPRCWRASGPACSRPGVRSASRRTRSSRRRVQPTPPLRPAGRGAGSVRRSGAGLARRRPPRRDDRTRRAATWAAWPRGALVVSLGVWGTELREQRDDQARLSAQLAGTLERLQDPSTETVRLQSDGGDVVAVALVSGDEVELVLDGLPVNEDGTSYVLWDEAPDGALRGVGAFDVTSGDLEVHRGIQLAGDTQRLLVTQEKGDTPPEVPTLPVLAVGQV
jgi:hypothetical protein